MLGKRAVGINVWGHPNIRWIFICGARGRGALDRMKQPLDEIDFRKYMSATTTNFICWYLLLHLLNLDTTKPVSKYVKRRQKGSV